jgi:integrase
MSKQRNPNGLGNYRKLADGRIGWRQTIDGKTRELSAKTMPELKAKVKKVADLPIITEKYKVVEWFDKWLEVYVKPLKKAATYNQYNDLYRVHVKPVIGHRKMTTIKPVDIQEVIAKMNKAGYASKTMKETKGVMNRGFSRAFIEKIIAENPVHDIEIPTKQAKERKTLTAQELVKIFESLKNSRWIWSVKLLLVTGLRRGELLALKWSDVDFANRRLTVDESNSLTGLGDTKSAKAHYVPLSDKATEYLNGQKQQLIKENNPILFDDDLKATELIFPSENGTMLKPQSYYTMLSRAAKKVGIQASPHCLRHTFVYMTRETLSLKELQSVLGHDESTTTLDIYGDMLSETLDKTAKQIDSVFNQLDLEAKKIEEKKEGKVLEFKQKKAK